MPPAIQPSSAAPIATRPGRALQHRRKDQPAIGEHRNGQADAGQQQPEIAARDRRERDDVVEAHRRVGDDDDRRGRPQSPGASAAAVSRRPAEASLRRHVERDDDQQPGAGELDQRQARAAARQRSSERAAARSRRRCRARSPCAFPRGRAIGRRARSAAALSAPSRRSTKKIWTGMTSHAAPSLTSISVSRAAWRSPVTPWRAPPHGGLRRALRRAPRPLRAVLEDAQETRVGRKHQRRTGVGERVTVGLQAR